MPFSPNDSVDILIRARTQGEQEIRALAGAATVSDEQFKRLQATLLTLDGNLKALTTSVVTLTKTLEEQALASNSAASGANRLGSSARDAAAELRFLEGSMPIRAAAQFVASVEGIAPLLRAAFPIIGAVALIEVLEKVPGAINKMALSLDGWTEKSKHAFEASIKHADKWYDHVLELAMKVSAMKLIGLDGSVKDSAEIGIVQGDIALIKKRRDDIKAELDSANAILFDAAHPQYKYQLGEFGTPGRPVLSNYHSDLDIEHAKVIKETLDPELSKFQYMLDEYQQVKLPSAQKELEADAKAERERSAKKLQTDAAEAARIEAAIIRGADRHEMNPAGRYAEQANDEVRRMLEKNPHMDTARVLSAVDLAWLKMSMEAFEKQKLEDMKLNNLIFDPELGHTKKGDHQQIEFMLSLLGLDKATIHGWMEHFNDLDGVSREERSNRIANFNIDRRYLGRLAAINAGPAGEMSAFYGAQNQAQLEALQNKQASLETAKDSKDPLTEQKRANDLYERETKQIGLDTELKIAEIRRQEREEDRKVLGELFDAFDSGRRGAVSQFFRSKLTGIERTMFSNALEMPLQSIRSHVQGFLTPHELDGQGNPNWLGKALQGTPLGIDQASPEIRSRKENTDAINNLTAALTGRSTAGGGTSTPATGSVLSKALSFLPGGASLGSALSSLFHTDAGSRNASGGDVHAITANTDPDIAFFRARVGDVSPGAGHVNYLSSGLDLAGAGIGAFAGFHQGGVQGSLAASAALVGGVTQALSGLSKSLNVLGPVGMVASMALGFVSMLSGMSVQERYNQMQNNVAGSYDRLPPSMSETFDISGNQSHITGPGQAVVLNLHVNALDSKSIVDHWQPIANAISHAVNMNHSVVDSIRQAR